MMMMMALMMMMLLILILMMMIMMMMMMMMINHSFDVDDHVDANGDDDYPSSKSIVLIFVYNVQFMQYL
jgi:flagellar biogenesis protein FliO